MGACYVYSRQAVPPTNTVVFIRDCQSWIARGVLLWSKRQLKKCLAGQHLSQHVTTLDQLARERIRPSVTLIFMRTMSKTSTDFERLIPNNSLLV